MKIATLTPSFVEVIPDRLEKGTLYICERYHTAIHLCCCGCGEEVVTPLSPVEWSVHMSRGKISLHPSIGNWSFECRSHYWIRNNQVVWAGGLTDKQIKLVKARDVADKELYIAKVNKSKSKSGGIIASFMAFLKRLWP